MSAFNLWPFRASSNRLLIRKLKKPVFCIKGRQQFCTKSNHSKSLSPPFQHSKTGSFYQDPPALGNQFLEDCFLQASLRRILPQKVNIFDI